MTGFKLSNLPSKRYQPIEDLISQNKLDIEYYVSRFSPNGHLKLNVDAHFVFMLVGEITPIAEELPTRRSPNCDNLDECNRKALEFIHQETERPSQKNIDECEKLITTTISKIQNVNKVEVTSAYYRCTQTCSDCNGSGKKVCDDCKGSGEISSPELLLKPTYDSRGIFITHEHQHKTKYAHCRYCNNGLVDCNRCSASGEVTLQVETIIYLKNIEGQLTYSIPPEFKWVDNFTDYSFNELTRLIKWDNESNKITVMPKNNLWSSTYSGVLDLSHASIGLTLKSGETKTFPLKFIGSKPFDGLNDLIQDVERL